MPSTRPHIWLFQDGEPLPFDPQAHLMRTGLLAERLVTEGFKVTWWASRFDHGQKKYRQGTPEIFTITTNYEIHLLDGPSYKKNLSLDRIRHYRACASHFRRSSQSMEKPDIILASYPSPELCYAAGQYAEKMKVPFIVDVRDPWPAIFPEYFSPLVRWTIYPVCFYYERKYRTIARAASGTIAVSRAMLKWAEELSPRERTNGVNRVFYIGYNSLPSHKVIDVPESFSAGEPLICLLVSSGGKSYDGFTLVEAARLFQKKGEKRVRFVITNEGEMTGRWKKKAEGLKSVEFVGRLSHAELQSLLHQAHVGLILMQGGITRFWLGNKIFEYLSASLALINNVPNETSEIVEKFRVGVNIKEKTPSMLAEALEKLLEDPSIVKRYMENSRDAFQKHFERNRIYDDYIDYLKKKIGNLSNSYQRL